MARSKKVAIAALAFLVAGFSAFAQGAPITAEKNGISLSILFKGDSAEITVSSKVKGWVSVGIDPSSKMKDAEFFIGYVKDGTVSFRDDYGTGYISHDAMEKAGSKGTIISAAGTETDGTTTITFVVPKTAVDGKHKSLSAGQHNIILAASNSDGFTGMHSKVGKVTVTLP